MKRLIVAALAALTLVPAGFAAPDPNDNLLEGADPFNSFVVTRILPNQREVALAVLPLADGWTTSTVVRDVTLQAARQNRTNNPSWTIVVYGPIDPPLTFWTNDDRVWDSRVNL